MRAFIAAIAALIIAGTAFAQTGDAYLDSASAIIASPKPLAEVMRIVEEGEVDPNRFHSDGNTLMHYAAIAGRADVMEALIARGGRLDIRRNQSDAATPVELAKRPEIVAFLTRIGAIKAPQPGSYRSTGSATLAKPTTGSTNSAAAESPRRKLCNERHYSSSALCSDTTCKMREYRKWQTCLSTGSYM